MQKKDDDLVEEIRSAFEVVAFFGTKHQFNVMGFGVVPYKSKSTILRVNLTLKFYLTSDSNENPILLNIKGKHPIHIGTIQVQHCKLKIISTFWERSKTF